MHSEARVAWSLGVAPPVPGYSWLFSHLNDPCVSLRPRGPGRKECAQRCGDTGSGLRCSHQPCEVVGVSRLLDVHCLLCKVRGFGFPAVLES